MSKCKPGLDHEKVRTIEVKTKGRAPQPKDTERKSPRPTDRTQTA